MRRLIILLLTATGIMTAGDYSLTEPARLVARPDYSLGVVFIERWRGDYLLGTERVIPIKDYLDYQLNRSVTEAWQAKSERTQTQRDLAADASGLIPDIVLPKLPIFGEGSRIDISGRDRITLGGRQTFVRGIYQTPGTGLFPELKMEQQLSVILNGTIGERTKVNIDYDVERPQADNKVLLSYTGTEDEILQSIELGDTRLTIPTTAYTGDLPAHTGLFGASAKGKLGGVDIYAIASREESQAQSQSFTGRRVVSLDTIYDGQYVTRRFYSLPETAAVTNVYIYIDDKNQSNNQTSQAGIATVWPQDPTRMPDSLGGWTYDRAPGAFDLKASGKDFILHPGNLIEFPSAIDDRYVVGAIICTATDTIGGAFYGDSLVLALLKPERPDSASLTWDYELRNVYSLRRSEVTMSAFHLFRDSTGTVDPEYEDSGPNAGKRFSQILGIAPDGNGMVDYPYFDSKTGLIWFPDRKPFASTGLSSRDSLIYRKDPSQMTNNEGHRYFMVVQYSSATEKYYLGQPDISEQSEKVVVNGVTLTRGVDYTIDYKAGTLQFLHPLLPDANIQVTFSYQPLFSMTQKSLVGARAEWNPSTTTRVGSSLFYRSEGMGDDKPSLGSESFRRMIAEADASYSVTSDAVSAFMDRLPLLRAQAASRFDVAAEGALSLPDPNTRGLVWLDNFEGTTVTSNVSTTSSLWSWSSVPLGKDTSNFARQPVFWRTSLSGEQVPVESVFGLDVNERGNTHDYMRVIYTPDAGNPTSWAGIMTGPQGGLNLKDFENLEIVLSSRHRRGRLHFTAGYSIDEDAPRRTRSGRIAGYDGVLNTEDRNSNGILDAGEDTGLDTIFGPDSLWAPDSADDGNDDFNATTNPMGTENNGRPTPDGEDLDRTGFSRYNHYFECSIDLADNHFLQPLHGNWQLLRVPIHDSTLFVASGRPRWEDVRLIRVWFDDFDATDTIDFYSIDFTGSRWTSPLLTTLTGVTVRPPKRDTSSGFGHYHTENDTVDRVWVAGVSRKTDTSYTSPFEVKRDAQGRLEEEAALLIGYQHLRSDRRAIITRTATDREDYRDYGELRLYVHDDRNGLSLILRLGSDSLNYYEYVAPVESGLVVPGRDGKWYEVAIPLDSLPWLKLRRDSTRAPGDTYSSGHYRLRGNPTLADIRYTALGIENGNHDRITGGIWFNDLCLSEPRRDAGYGLQARTSIALSDFITAAANLNYSDPNFRRFSEGREVKTGGFGTTLAANILANIDRLLPYNWGLSIPLSYQVSTERDLPKYSTDYTDLRLTGAKGASEMATAESRTIALDNVRKQKTSNRWLNYTLEAFGLSWRDQAGTSQGPLSADTSRSSTTQLSYAISPEWQVPLKGDDELSLLPQSVHLSATETGRRDARRTIRPHRDSTVQLTNGISTDFGVDYSPVEDLTFEYDAQSERDQLPDSAKAWYKRLGEEASNDNGFTAGYSIEIADILTPDVDYSGEYSDDRLKEGLSYTKSRNMDNSGDVDLSLGIDLPEILTRLGAAKAKAPAVPKRDSTAADSTRKPVRPQLSMGDIFRRGTSGLSRIIEPIDFSYSFSRRSELVSVKDQSPWYYRLGFVDNFKYSDTAPPTSITRDRDNSLHASSGGRLGEFTATLAFDVSEGRQYRIISNNTNATLDSTTTWPDLSLSLGKVQSLFKQLATDSRLTSSYRMRRTVSGDLQRDTTGHEYLAMYGRSVTNSTELSPLLSWQTTWKKRITTTLAANYTMASAFNYRNADGSSRGESDTRTRGIDLSLSYSFAAPQGIKLPFLKKVRFSSDLSLTGTLRYANSTRRERLVTTQDPGPEWTGLQDDNSFSASVSASYRFSRSIEAGLETGYSRSKGLAPTTTETMDLDIWVLFRF